MEKNNTNYAKRVRAANNFGNVFGTMGERVSAAHIRVFWYFVCMPMFSALRDSSRNNSLKNHTNETNIG